MLNVHAYSRAQIEQTDLPGPSAVVCMADAEDQLARIRDAGNVRARLDMVFNDAKDDFALVRSPTAADASRILDFVRQHKDSVPHIVFQCQVGIGRSLAAVAAVVKIYGGDPSEALRHGTHNRKLFSLLLAGGG